MNQSPSSGRGAPSATHELNMRRARIHMNSSLKCLQQQKQWSSSLAKLVLAGILRPLGNHLAGPTNKQHQAGAQPTKSALNTRRRRLPFRVALLKPGRPVVVLIMSEGTEIGHEMQRLPPLRLVNQRQTHVRRRGRLRAQEPQL